MPTLAEPFPYYSNDNNSVMSLGGGIGIGLLRVTSFADDNKVDMITGDMTVNCILAATWKTAVTPDAAQVYNYVGYENPVLIKEFMNVNLDNFRESKESFGEALWVPHHINVQNNFCMFVLYFFLHLVPGLFFSMVERYLNKKPMIMKIYRNFFLLHKTLRYIITNNWTFTNDNTKSLLFQLNTRDRELFDFNIASIHWMNYYSVMYRCISLYNLKCDYNNKDYPKELYRRKMRYIEPVDMAIRWIFRFAVVYFSCKIVCGYVLILCQD
uniref:Fatty acyl-CoA reductase CG5065 n=2 Tax=Cacopsylla melanoneura TaxID=428564 RepID=A0A8D8WNJ0_9HEMI